MLWTSQSLMNYQFETDDSVLWFSDNFTITVLYKSVHNYQCYNENLFLWT